MLNGQPMKSLSNRSGIGNSSIKSVLDALEPAKINSRETSTQGITVKTKE